MTDRITPEQQGDGVDRRGFLECMAWVGYGAGLVRVRRRPHIPRTGRRAPIRRAKWISRSPKSATATSASPKSRIRMSPLRSSGPSLN